MNRGHTFKLVYLSTLSALAVALHAVEALIPVPYIFPGAKLGLANVVAVHVIYTYGLVEGLVVTGVRTVLGSLLGGFLLGATFILSAAGGLASTAVMGVLVVTGRERLSPVGVSVVGAITHNVAQLVAAGLITRQPALVYYLPALLAFGLPTGVLVGLISLRLKPLEGLIRSLLGPGESGS
ncbi:MAG: Gx transporter family protein [Firmicutes bacterium]|nr:Gx transporter family protein [Bacillota bacterium]